MCAGVCVCLYVHVCVYVCVSVCVWESNPIYAEQIIYFMDYLGAAPMQNYIFIIIQNNKFDKKRI